MLTEVKYVEIKCQLDATEVFIAELIAIAYVSGLQDAAASCKPDT